MKNIKKLFLLVVLSMLALVVTGCDKNKNKEQTYVQPTVTDGSSVVYTDKNNKVSVTKDEVYKFVRYSGGLTLLLQKIDDELLASYVSRISTDPTSDTYKYYIGRKNRMMYSTNDQDEIDALTVEEKAEAEESYDYTLQIMGYNTDELRDAYIKTLAARDLFAKEYLEKADKYSDYQITDEVLESYYNSKKAEGTDKAIVVSYDSMAEFNKALESAGLVIIDSQLVEKTILDNYIDEKKLSGLEKDYNQIDVTKIKLANDDALDAFEKLFKNKYGKNFDENAEYAKFSYDNVTNLSESLFNRIYGLKAGEYTYTASYDQTGIGNVYSVIYKLSNSEEGYAHKAFNVLTADEKNAIKADYIEDYVQTASNITSILVEYRNDLGIKFYDQELAYEYSKSYDTSYEFKKVMSCGNKLVEYKNEQGELKTITADDFYNYAVGISKEYYVMSTAIVELEQYLTSYTKLYGEVRDIDLNQSIRKTSFYDVITSNVETNYTEDTYGTEANYLYYTYGFDNKDDIVKYYYAANDLKTFTVIDNLFGEETITITEGEGEEATQTQKVVTRLKAEYQAKFQSAIDDYTNNYYSLYAYELKAVVDSDNNYKADNLKDNNTISAELSQIYTVITDLITHCNQQKEIESVTDVDTIMNAFVKAYNEGETTIEWDDEDISFNSVSDAKKKAIRLSYSKVNSGSAITNSAYASKTTDELNAAYRTIYNYMKDNSLTDSDDYYINNEGFVIDENGAHLIIAKFGTKLGSYKYTISSSSVSTINEAAENDSEVCSINQLAAAFLVELYDGIYTDADEAKETYNVTDYPLSMPTSLDFSAMLTVVENYYLTDSFVNTIFADQLSLTENDYYAKAKDIYASFLND